MFTSTIFNSEFEEVYVVFWDNGRWQSEATMISKS